MAVGCLFFLPAGFHPVGRLFGLAGAAEQALLVAVDPHDALGLRRVLPFENGIEQLGLPQVLAGGAEDKGDIVEAFRLDGLAHRAGDQLAVDDGGGHRQAPVGFHE